MNTTTMLRPWLGLVALSAVSLLGSTLSRPTVNTVERERLLQAAAEELDKLPVTIGGWRSEAGAPLSEELLQSLQCRAYQSRTYANEGTGERVSLLILAGNAGPLLTLRPEACYEGDQLDQTGSGLPMKFDSDDEFLKLTFQFRDDPEKTLQTYIAWRKARGRWQAPYNPRLTLGSQPMLFRLQVAATGAKPAGDATESDACRNFLADVLPVLDQASRSN
ncbi:MAG TPA: exosortase-associated EpsI family protein [Planctomycetaceae bacterium]|jgi:hypothetical protein